MNKSIINNIIIVVLIVLSGALFALIMAPNKSYTPEKVENTIQYLDNTNFEIELVQADLDTYENMSYQLTDRITSYIDSASIRYNIPIGLLHAIFRVESEYRFWITHPEVNIKYKDRYLKTSAIGLGGIIWEYWKDHLARENIAFAKSDLYLPSVNILAAASILRYLIDDEINKGHASEYNMINTIIKRYYGAYDKEYYSKMMRVTSDLWLKRLAKQIIAESQIDTLEDKIFIDTSLVLKGQL